ncbi:response regulator transcription factor [Streptomyces sp. NPDC091377]|uniref:response regulator transcription factor n=1 Tax=unclassified Streptomyces TaxID=2593676 RepID=UPI00380760E9
MHSLSSATPVPPTAAGPDDIARCTDLARGAGQRLLVVVPEPDVAELLTSTLTLAGYQVTRAFSGREALARVRTQPIDLIVLDPPLPDTDELAHRSDAVPDPCPPVLLLASWDTLGELVNDPIPVRSDYVTKPFRVAEVLARIGALLRDTVPGPAPRDAPRYADLLLDDPLCRARRGTRTLDLTPAEYRLLLHLVDNAHHVLSKDQISQYVWGEFRGDNAIEQLVSRLRRKVDRDAPALIHTRRGFGYWLGHADIETGTGPDPAM